MSLGKIILGTIGSGALIIGGASCAQNSSKVRVPLQPRGIVTTDTGLSSDTVYQGPDLIIHPSIKVVSNSESPKDPIDPVEPNLPKNKSNIASTIKNPAFFSDEFKVDPNRAKLDLTPIRDYHRFVGELSAFIGVKRFDFDVGKHDGIPGGLMGSYGLNLSKTNRDEGRFVIPNVTFGGFINTPENYWGRYGDVGFGGKYEKGKWSLIGEWVLRDSYGSSGNSDGIQWSSDDALYAKEFFRAGINYSNELEKLLGSSVGSRHSAGFLFDGADSNLIMSLMADIHYRPNRSKKGTGVEVVPFAEVWGMLDDNNTSYGNFVQFGGGVDFFLGNNQFRFTGGYRKATNGSDQEGGILMLNYIFRRPVNHGYESSK